jgi:hypothetical protein
VKPSAFVQSNIARLTLKLKPNFLDIALLLFPVTLLLRVPNDPDLWWHLRVGQDILRGIWPFGDTYTWSMPGFAWVDHEWLTNLLMYGIFRATGLLGLGAVFILIGLCAYGVAAHTGWLIASSVTGPSPSRAAGWRLAAIVMIGGLAANYGILGTRAQMITLLGFALVNLLLWQYLLGKRRTLWVLPVLFALWANLHGGMVIGIFHMGLCLLALLAAGLWPTLRQFFPFNLTEAAHYPRKVRHLMVVLVTSVVASLLNPYTYRIYEEALRTSLDSYARTQIQEWKALNFQEPIGLAVGIFLFLLVWWLLWSRRYHSAWHLLLFPVYLYLGVSSTRHSGLLVLFSLPWLYVALAASPGVREFLDATVKRLFAIRAGRGLYIAYNSVVLLVPLGALLVQAQLFVRTSLDSVQLARSVGYPYQAVAYLKSNAPPGTRLFNGYNWGGYLVWFFPEQKVFIDGRMPSWRDRDSAILEEYVHIADLAPDWMELLRARQVNLVLTPKDSVLATGLRQTAGFERAYEDDLAVVYRRTN